MFDFVSDKQAILIVAAPKYFYIPAKVKKVSNPVFL
jgi:hypothetical protein